MRDELAPILAALESHLAEFKRQRGLATEVGSKEARTQFLLAKRYFLELEGRMLGAVRA